MHEFIMSESNKQLYVQLTFCKNEHAVITLKIALIVIVLIYTSANTNSTRLGL